MRILYLLAGVSYYKTSAAPLIDLGELQTTAAADGDFLHGYYVNGLGEFAYRNGLDLRGLRLEGPDGGSAAARATTPTPAAPSIPFGGGIDSIVTVESLVGGPSRRRRCASSQPPAQRFAAIEDAAAVAGLPVTPRRPARSTPSSAAPSELGFLNGHVPVTAIVTRGRPRGRRARRGATPWCCRTSGRPPCPRWWPTAVAVNHQWSKGEDFEQAFGDLVLSTLGPGISVFSYLRPRSELWVGAAVRRPRPSTTAPFAVATEPSTRTRRSDSTTGAAAATSAASSTSSWRRSWTRAELEAVFAGDEPCRIPANEERFRALLGLGTGVKPFECVGDTDECRAAVVLTSARQDRADCDARARCAADRAGPPTPPTPPPCCEPRGTHRIPDRYAPTDLLVRAR